MRYFLLRYSGHTVGTEKGERAVGVGILQLKSFQKVYLKREQLWQVERKLCSVCLPSPDIQQHISILIKTMSTIGVFLAASGKSIFT